MSETRARISRVSSVLEPRTRNIHLDIANNSSWSTGHHDNPISHINRLLHVVADHEDAIRRLLPLPPNTEDEVPEGLRSKLV